MRPEAVPLEQGGSNLGTMPVVSEMYHPSGFSFAMQRKIVLRREIHQESWHIIVEQVRTLQGEVPSAQHVSNTYHRFDTKSGRVRSGYSKCGRKPWKWTKEIDQ